MEKVYETLRFSDCSKRMLVSMVLDLHLQSVSLKYICTKCFNLTPFEGTLFKVCKTLMLDMQS